MEVISYKYVDKVVTTGTTKYDGAYFAGIDTSTDLTITTDRDHCIAVFAVASALNSVAIVQWITDNMIRVYTLSESITVTVRIVYKTN